MELETQRVWDYAGDAYVHRLIQNRHDGKLVELPSIGSTSNEYGSDWTRTDRGAGPNYADNAAQEKMERMGEEFAHLLTSQLESQRAYYVTKLTELKQDLAITTSSLMQSEEQSENIRRQRKLVQKRLDEAKEESSKCRSEKVVLNARVSELERGILEGSKKDKARLEKKLDKSTEAVRTLQHDLQVEQAQTRGLSANLAQVKAELMQEREASAKIRLDMTDLQEQLRDVMFTLSAQSRIVNEGGEAEGGTLIVRQPVEEVSVPKRKKKKPKKPNLPQIADSSVNEAEAEAET